MTSAFGTRWTTTHGDNFAATSGRIWAIELAGFDGHQIQRGLKLAVREVWPPVLAEFKAMCLGVIPLATVELERNGEPSAQSPFTVLVGRLIAYDEWRMADPRRREQMLLKAHEQAKAHVMAGGALPTYTPAAQQLTVDDERPAPPPIMVTAEQAMAEIRQVLGIRTPSGDDEKTEPGPRQPKPCKRCHGTRKDPLPGAWHPEQNEPGECLACYGSGNEANYNRIVHEDGTTEERLP